MKRTRKKNAIGDEEAIKNLLIVSLLKDGVDLGIIGKATGIPEMTIRGKFPMKEIKKLKEQKKTEKRTEVANDKSTEEKVGDTSGEN